jgi:hypothetical protein
MRYFTGETVENYQRVITGDLRREPFSMVWNNSAYREFRDSFDSGSLSSLCRNCPKRFEV